MNNSVKTVRCSSEKCKSAIKADWHYFKHDKCGRTLCFWCVLEAYKLGIEDMKKTNPKYWNTKKVRAGDMFSNLCKYPYLAA